MIFKTVDEIIREFEEAYERKQVGWHILYGFDSWGRLNIYILDDRGSGWALILEPHFGLGAKVERVNLGSISKIDSLGFGFRRLSKELFKRIIREMREYGRLSEETMNLIKKNPPLKKSELRLDEGILIGPYLYHPKIESVDDRIASKLRERFEEEIKKRYRYIG